VYAECEVRRGNEQQAAWLASAENIKHGKPRTNKDKQAAVMLALQSEIGKQASARKIAAHCCVSVPMVSRMQKRLAAGVTVATPKRPPKIKASIRANDPEEATRQLVKSLGIEMIRRMAPYLAIALKPK
jgi:hypothetical protein